MPLPTILLALALIFCTSLLVNDCTAAPTAAPPSSPSATCKLPKPALQAMVCTQEQMEAIISRSHANGGGCTVFPGVPAFSPSLSALNGLLQILSDVESPQPETLEIISSLTEILHGNSIPECLQLDIASGGSIDFSEIEGHEICILQRMASILKTFYVDLVFAGHTQCPSSSNSHLSCNPADEDTLNDFSQTICSSMDTTDYESVSQPYCICSDCNFSSPVVLFEALIEWTHLALNSSSEDLLQIGSTLNSSILPHLKDLFDNDCSGTELPHPCSALVETFSNLSSSELSQGCLVQRLNILFRRFYSDYLYFDFRIVDSPLNTCTETTNPPPSPASTLTAATPTASLPSETTPSSASTTEAQTQQRGSSVYDRYSPRSHLRSSRTK